MAVEALESGATARSVAQGLSIPLGTVENWQRGRLPLAVQHLRGGGRLCRRCGALAHDHAGADPADVAYVLGVYLGDGCLARQTRTWSLRVSLDVAYPNVIDEVASTVGRLRGTAPYVHRPPGERYAVVTSYWKSWPCWLLPHEPGPKHRRRIQLQPWQIEVVRRRPGSLLRGLIQTDGWRGVNRVTVKGTRYEYPRYQFSSRSDDIRRLFTDACDELGIAWRPWGRYEISVARRDAVARLDQYVGPKT